MTNKKPFVAACAAYPLDDFNDWAAYETKLRSWINEAVEHKATLLVFPEYGAMELVRIFDESLKSDLQKQIDVISHIAADVDALHQSLAIEFGITILAASLPLRLHDGRTVNRARLFGPHGMLGYQDKLMMTRFEREIWHVEPGSDIKVFETGVGKLGIAICYDAEFPLLSRKMTEQGAQLLLVPSCTDTLAGYYRVRTGAKARALENQCYTLHAPTIGKVNYSQTADAHVGAAAVYGPSDLGFPANGVINCGEIDHPGWVYAEIDLEKVARVREQGRVLNHQHWQEQFNYL